MTTWTALGTTALIAVTEASSLGPAEELARSELEAFDRACSRFRSDAEILHVSDAPHVVSARLFRIMEVACQVARYTKGAVDPTVGSAMVALGYDRDFADLHVTMRRPDPVFHPAPGWKTVALNRRDQTVQAPAGTVLDVGASAKALASDQIATLIVQTLHTGVLVDLGGDIAVGGPTPSGGWSVGVSAVSGGPAEQAIGLFGGGLATSSPDVRTWFIGKERMNHIVDPRTGRPAPSHWKSASVAAPTCVEANALSTAAVVWGPQAPAQIGRRHGVARLVDYDGDVRRVGSWPLEHADST